MSKVLLTPAKNSRTFPNNFTLHPMKETEHVCRILIFVTVQRGDWQAAEELAQAALEARFHSDLARLQTSGGENNEMENDEDPGDDRGIRREEKERAENAPLAHS